MKLSESLKKADLFKEKEKLSPIDEMRFHPEFYWSVCLKTYNYQQVKNAVTVGESFSSNTNIVKFNGCNWDPFLITTISIN
jgi:hypothetical protein